MKRTNYIVIITLIITVAIFLSACNDIEDGELTLANVNVIDEFTLEAEFNNGVSAIVTDFTPKPLEIDIETNVSFTYKGEVYSAEVLYHLPDVKDQVQVNVLEPIRTVNPRHILGGNLGSWTSPHHLNTTVEKYYKNTGAGIVRYPGGNISNNYCWKGPGVFEDDYNETGKFEDFDDWSSWAISIDDYLSFVKNIDAEPMYSLNPFSHKLDGVSHDYIDEAVELVKKFKDEGFTGAFYEVGNENDGHWNPFLDINDYISRFIKLAEAVKAEDPSANLVGPVSYHYNFNDDKAEYSLKDFIDELNQRGKLDLLDYVSYHKYGTWISDYYNTGGIDLTIPQQHKEEIIRLRNYLDDIGGDDIGIAITEYNSAIWEDDTDEDKFTINQALYTADFIGGLFANPVDIANIWVTLFPGDDPHSLLDQDSGEPTQNYWASYMINDVFGGLESVTVLETSDRQTTDKFTSYAVKKQHGNYGILLINKEDEYKEIIVSIPDIEQGDIQASAFSENQYNNNQGPNTISSEFLEWDNGEIKLIIKGNSITTIEIY